MRAADRRRDTAFGRARGGDRGKTGGKEGKSGGRGGEVRGGEVREAKRPRRGPARSRLSRSRRARSVPDCPPAPPKPRRARPRRGGRSRGKLFIDAAALLPTRHCRLGHGGRRSRGPCPTLSRTRARKFRESVYLSYFAVCFSC